MQKQGILNLSIAVLLLIVVPVIILREYRSLKPKRRIFDTPEESVQERYAYSRALQKEFVFLVFSQPGEPFSTQNMHSLLEQKYPRYRIVFMNIGDDPTPLREAKEYVKTLQERNKVSFVQCADEEEFYAEYSKIVYSCRDEEIVIQMDGKDWLASDHILETLNEAYEDPDVWLTYGEYLEYPSYRKGRALPPRSTKKGGMPWTISRLKTFYAGLFKQLHLEDDGTATSKDPSFLLPMVEMAKWHVRFIPDVLYVRSAAACAEESVRGEAVLRREVRQKADCILFSDNSPEKLQKTLHSLKEHLFDVGQISVLFQSTPEKHSLYRLLQEKNPRIRFREICPDGRDLKDVLTFTLSPSLSSNEHVLVLTDAVTLADEVFTSEYIATLEKVKAFAFFLATSREVLRSVDTVPLERGVLAKKVSEPKELGATIYRKETLRKLAEEKRFKTIASLVRNLRRMEGEVALHLEQSPISSR